MTKVILNQTVAKLGIAGDVVDVKAGYARNFLLPQALAAPWSVKSEKQVTLRKEAAKRRAVENIETANAQKEALEAGSIIVTRKAASTGKLFGAVTGAAVAEAIQSTLKIAIDKRKVQFAEPIKELGSYTAEIHIFEGIKANVKLSVVAAKK